MKIGLEMKGVRTMGVGMKNGEEKSRKMILKHLNRHWGGPWAVVPTAPLNRPPTAAPAPSCASIFNEA